MILFIRKKI